jgi:anti-sigma factor RsiW
MTDLVARLRFRRDHRWAPDHMSDYLDGELSSRGVRRLQRHLGVCHDCRRLLAGLRATVNALRGLPQPTPRADAVQLAAAVRLRLHEPRKPE